MPDRATIHQTTQIAAEATAGTAMTTTFRRLRSMTWDMGIKAEIQKFRAQGYKFPSVTAIGKEWSEGSLSGSPTFDEIVYPLCGVLEHVTPTRLIPTTGLAYEWVFDPSSTAPDTIKTFTAETGEAATRAHQFAYVLVTALELAFSRSSIEVSGALMGRRITDGITPASGATELPIVPVVPAQVDVYLADTAAGLDAASALQRAISASWGVSGRFSPIWALNSSFTSFAGHVESEPTGTAKLKLEADATGMGLLTTMRANAVKFLRIKATGAEIETGNNYTLQLDTCVRVIAEPSQFSDEDGLYAIEWSFEWFHDATWNKAVRVEVVNTTSTL